MNTFNTISDLSKQFKMGNIPTLPNIILVDGVEFKYIKEVNVDMHTSLLSINGHKCSVIYESTDSFVVFAWNVNEKLQIVPSTVLSIPRVVNEVNDRDIARHYDEKTIGRSLDVVIMGLNNNQPIKCKVDTGAELCSLDASDIKIVPSDESGKELVKFTFNDKIYTIALVQQQGVQTADGGINYRPVVNLSVKINGQVYSDVLFNLNDRSDMPDPILLGLNFLQQTDCFIDPKKESADNEISSDDLLNIVKVCEEYSVVIDELPNEDKKIINEAQIKDLLEAIYTNPDVTLADIIQHMKSDTLRVLENIQY